MVRETLFPLTVAKDALDAVDNEYEAQVCFGSSLAKLVGPFLRENVEHTEFVLMKTLLVINGICQAGCARAEEAKSRHTKLLFQYLSGRNGKRQKEEEQDNIKVKDLKRRPDSAPSCKSFKILLPRRPAGPITPRRPPLAQGLSLSRVPFPTTLKISPSHNPPSIITLSFSLL